ncbi:MAG: hypothetical protein IJZ49_06775 [Alistipes sp.]|nr:hypothetical protein [Alistipes sp.]
MKNLLLLTLLLIGVINVEAQEVSKPRKVYCQIVGTQKLLSTKCTIEVDFGQNQWGSQTLVDENGKPISFNSMVDAMNQMGKLGWEFEDSYVITVSGQNVYHWLLSKCITDEEINDGLKTQRQYREEQKSIKKEEKYAKKQEKE